MQGGAPVLTYPLSFILVCCSGLALGVEVCRRVVATLSYVAAVEVCSKGLHIVRGQKKQLCCGVT